MIIDHERRFELLQRLRSKNEFGFPGEILEAMGNMEHKADDTSAYKPSPQPDELVGFLTKTPEFNLREDMELGSTPREELVQRLNDLKYRAKWLKALLSLTEDELSLFEDALKKMDK